MHNLTHDILVVKSPPGHDEYLQLLDFSRGHNLHNPHPKPLPKVQVAHVDMLKPRFPS
jgi:hypothetical protein